jgi:hypothetical protein
MRTVQPRVSSLAGHCVIAEVTEREPSSLSAITGELVPKMFGYDADRQVTDACVGGTTGRMEPMMMQRTSFGFT